LDYCPFHGSRKLLVSFCTLAEIETKLMTNQTAKITKYLSKCESRVYTNVKGGNRGSGGSFYDDNHGKKKSHASVALKSLSILLYAAEYISYKEG
jgi:hypothetical protein